MFQLGIAMLISRWAFQQVSREITSVKHVSGFLGDFRWSPEQSVSQWVGLPISELKNGMVKHYEFPWRN